MAKPDLIKWVSGDEAAKITDPGATKKLAGFLYKEKPPFQYFNWLFNRLSKWLLGMQGGYFDVVVGSSTQVTNLEATHVLSDLDDALVTAGTKVLILDGTHTLLTNFALANNSIKIQSESASAIIDVSTFTFTLSGNNVDADVKFINSGAGDIILSGIGSFLKTYDVAVTDIYVVNGSKAVSTGTSGGIKNKNYYGLDPDGNININTSGAGRVFINGKQQGFRGCLLTTSVSTIDTATIKIIDWDNEIYDTDNIHSLVTNIERMVVPTGISKIKVNSTFEWLGDGTGSFTLRILKNGVIDLGGVQAHDIVDSRNGTYIQQIKTPEIDVVPGDYFSIDAYQNSGSTLTIMSSEARGWVLFRLIE